MKIEIAGQDRTAEWKPALDTETARMAERGECVFFPPEISALRLRGAKNEAEYLDALTDLVRRRHHIDTLGFRVPRRAGAAGAVMGKIRSFLWKLLRYQHDRMAYRQNLVNSHLMALLEMQGREIAHLRRTRAERNGGGAKNE